MRLAPGDYLVLAWSMMNEPIGSLESLIRAHAGAIRRINLQPNETKTLEVQAARTPRER